MERLCDLVEIPPGESRGFRVQNKPVLAVEQDGDIFVYLNACPHLGIELNYTEHQFLDDAGEFIVCANHGALFTKSSGECLQGPCLGRALVPVPIQVREGVIYIEDIPENPF